MESLKELLKIALAVFIMIFIIGLPIAVLIKWIIKR